MTLKKCEKTQGNTSSLREPDWDVWGSRTFCKVWQLVALALNAEPDEGSSRIREIKGDEYKKYLRRARSALSNDGEPNRLPFKVESNNRYKSKINWSVEPVMFIQYADLIGWELPEAFKQAVAGRYSGDKPEESTTRNEVQGSLPHISSKKVPSNVRNAAETRKSKTTLLLLYAALNKAIDFKGEEQLQQASEFILEGLKELGVEKTKPTIERHIREACEILLQTPK